MRRPLKLVAWEAAGISCGYMAGLLTPLAPVWVWGAVTCGSVIFLIALYLPDVREWLDPANRVIRRAKAEEKRKADEREQSTKEVINRLRETPCLSGVYLDPTDGTVGAYMRVPRTWRRFLIKVAVWTANRRWWVDWPVTERILYWVHERLKDKAHH